MAGWSVSGMITASIPRSEPIDRMMHGSLSPVQDAAVDHRRAHVALAETFLNGSDVMAVFEQLSGE
jgi:hypothetical protein